jgi:hypothetical protein
MQVSVEPVPPGSLLHTSLQTTLARILEARVVLTGSAFASRTRQQVAAVGSPVD